tara:strand:+ start:734 stop:2083 length:1350 start_codon:yes stop_codon:yes gene_type:complete
MTDASAGNINVEISPSNTLSNGKISFRGGAPVIQFIIGEQERMLIGKSVRLVGDFRVRLNSLNDGTEFVTGGNLHLPARLGTYAMIDQVVLKSQQSHQVIEHIRHYSRFCASFIPVTNSLADSKCHLAESSLVMPNYNIHKTSVTDLPSQGTTGNSFCMSLPCGLFNGVADIPLSSKYGLGGLLVEIHLAPDDNVLFDITGAANTFGDAFYELSNVKLVAEMVNPSPQMLSQYSSGGNTFEYNTISSYYASINSSNAIINFNLGMRRVLGVFANFLPSASINSLSADGTATPPLINSDGSVADVTQVVFTRGGTRYPLEYNVDTSQRANTQLSQQLTVDSQVHRNFLNSIKSFANLSRSGVSSRGTWLSDHSAAGVQTKANLTAVENQNVFGVGVAYDTISGDGVDFSQLNWGLQMECDLTTSRPHAAYVFVHSKATLVFNSSGLQVVQ